MTPANDNLPRPPSFDARIMAYRPGLRRLAYRLGYRGEEAVDLVTDTIIYCLEHWQNFQGDANRMWNWLYWQMRGQVSAIRKKKGVPFVYGGAERKAPENSTPASQISYVELSQALSKMTGRDGAVLLRRAMGDGLEEIGRDMGISRERARQLEERARAVVREAA